MWIHATLAVGLTPLLCLARGFDARQSLTCNSAAAADSGDTCSSFSSEYALTVQRFATLNPGVACPGNLVGGQKYCVDGKVSTDQSMTSTSSPTKTQSETSLLSSGVTAQFPKPTSTHSGNGVATPSPFQNGMTGNCDNFYMVETGQPCSDILKKYNIPLGTFYSWNPAVGSTCTNLQPGYNVCVGVIGRPLKPSNGISTPWAVQTGIPTNCNKFYKVRSGDSCYSVTSKYSLSLSKFYAWNPAVGSRCTTLVVDDYVCVGRIGYNPSTVTAGTGVATPKPYEPGMVRDCNRFHYVQPGDTCKSIAAKKKVSVENIERWNPKAGRLCTGLWTDYYICIGIESTGKSS